MSRKSTREERLLSMLPQQSLFGFTREQSEQALKDIMDTYQTSLFAYAYQQCGNYDAAHDILQRAWLELYINLSQLGEEGVYGSNAHAWLRKIISNAAINYHKTQSHFISLDPSEGMWLLVSLVNRFAYPDAVVACDEIREELSIALPKLSVIQQKAIVLRFFRDQKLEEIAVELEIPLSTVKSHLRRGLRQLREHIQRAGIGSQDIRVWEDVRTSVVEQVHEQTSLFHSSNKRQLA